MFLSESIFNFTIYRINYRQLQDSRKKLIDHYSQLVWNYRLIAYRIHKVTSCLIATQKTKGTYLIFKTDSYRVRLESDSAFWFARQSHRRSRKNSRRCCVRHDAIVDIYVCIREQWPWRLMTRAIAFVARHSAIAKRIVMVKCILRRYSVSQIAPVICLHPCVELFDRSALSPAYQVSVDQTRAVDVVMYINVFV